MRSINYQIHHKVFSICFLFRACLHGDWGPQVGEVTLFSTIISSHFNLIAFT